MRLGVCRAHRADVKRRAHEAAGLPYAARVPDGPMTTDACLDRELLRDIVDAANAAGHDTDAALRAAGVGPFDELDARVPLHIGYRLWRTLEDLLEDRLIGVRLATSLTEGAVDLADYLVGACESLRDALTMLERYHRLIHDEAFFVAQVNGDTARLVVTYPPVPQPPASMVEWALAIWTTIAERLMPQAVFDEMWVTHRVPPGLTVADYESLLGMRVRFEMEQLAVLLPAAALDAPNPGADPRLRDLLVSQAELRLAQLPPRALTLTERVRQALLAALPEGDLDADAIAKQLHMSGRTLRRRLSDESTSLKAVLEGLRQAEAERYLRETTRSLDEISYLLGFSQPGSFHRAFKRWTGRTPAAYRAENDG